MECKLGTPLTFIQTNMQIGGQGKGKEATSNETKVVFMCLQDGPFLAKLWLEIVPINGMNKKK